MKITTDDAIYIQKSDLLYLQQLRYPLPKILKSKIYNYVVLGKDTTSDFAKFTEKDEIELFSQMDWIFEYDSILNMTLDDINRLSEEVIEERLSIANAPSDNTKPDRFELLNLKIKSLRDALLFKKGSLKVQLPKELRIFYQQPKQSFFKKFISKIS